MFNSQVECSSLLNIVIQIKGNNYLIRISFVELYREQFLLIRIYGIDVRSLTFVTYKTSDCKRNIITSGFSVENESMFTFVM